MSTFEIHPATNGEWYWKLVADNGETIAVGETHPSRSNAWRAALMVKEIAAKAEVEDA